MANNPSQNPLKSNTEFVIENDYCIGCGACVGLSDNRLALGFDQFGMLKAQSLDDTSSESLPHIVDLVCPFSNHGPNEDEIGKLLYHSDSSSHDPRIGYFKMIAAGHVTDSGIRDIATSGGIITWILCKLLAEGHADHVVHVREEPQGETGNFFKFAISSSPEEVRSGAKSRYYPIEMSGVIELMKTQPGRYVVVGVPCFIKAIRRLALVDPVINERVTYTVALICGHLKSRAFAEYFAWQSGVHPKDLKGIDFRVKQSEGTAGDYAVRVSDGKRETVKTARSFFGSNWGLNFFRYKACDFCDDVFGECADVTVGDAWIPPYIKDPKGNSVVVVRSNPLMELINSGLAKEELELDSISTEQAAASQAGGLRDRRQGLAYRLSVTKTMTNDWVPDKRVKATKTGIAMGRRMVYWTRMALRSKSHTAWKKAVAANDFHVFRKEMTPLMNRVKLGNILTKKGFVLMLKGYLRPIKKRFMKN